MRLWKAGDHFSDRILGGKKGVTVWLAADASQLKPAKNRFRGSLFVANMDLPASTRLLV